jgi:hypothetical protein
MRAIVAERFGGYQNLKLADIPEPAVSDGRVLVRITAAGVTPLDRLADRRIGQDVDGVDRHVVLPKHVDKRGREAALRVRRGALHEQDHRMGVDDLDDVSLGRFGACRFRHEHSPSAISLDRLGGSVISITPGQVGARDGIAMPSGWRWSSGP